LGGVKRKLLKYLMLENEVTLNGVITGFNLSKSDVTDIMIEINQSFDKDVIITDQQGIIYISEKSKMLCYKSFFHGKEKLFTYHEVNARYNLILIELLVDKEYSSLQKLADVCLVSKNTILNDMKAIKNDLEQKGLDIVYSRKKGYSITGLEFSVRNLLVAAVKTILRSSSGRILLEEKGLITESEIFLLRKRLEQVEMRIGIQLTDEQLDELPYIIQLVMKRAYKFNRKWSFRIEKYDIKNTVEYPQIKNMLWDYNGLNETDLLYLSLQVLSSNMVESALQISDGDEISIATEKFIQNIESYLAIRISKRSELREKVILHMRPAIYRNLLGFQINNPLTEEFIREHQEIYNVVQKSVHPFEQIIHHRLSKQEVVYLSMIVLGWIYQTEETEAIFQAVVLCQSGTSISKLLLVTLQSMFSDIDFIGAYSVRQFEQLKDEVDFIFTTVPIKSSTTTFLIPSILDKQSRIDLKRRVNTEMKDNNYTMTRKLISSISHYIPTENVEEVSKIIDNFFRSGNIDVEDNFKKKEEQFIFSIDHISIVDESIKWEELVNFSMKSLLKRKSITESYINETNKVFFEHYEQMIIAPDVFLPHVSPEYGVIKMDFQVVIFKNPIRIPSGGEVKIVVALAPSVDNEHVSTLIRLNNLLLNPEVLLEIIEVNNVLAIKKLLNK